MSESVSRILLRAPNWLGDAVLALPAMVALRRHFASAYLAVAGPPGVAAIFREETDVKPDSVIEISDRSREVIATLQGGGFDLGVLFPNSFRSAWKLKRAGIKERWGFATFPRGWLLTKRSRRERGHGIIHQSDYYRQLVRGLGVVCDDSAPRMAVSGPSAARAQAILAQRQIPIDARLVGFAPGAAYGQAKQWPPERVAQVAARLVRDSQATCLMLGASHDRSAARAIESWLRAHAPDTVTRVIDLVGRTSLGALAGIVARCQAFVTNDSGAMHLASALQRPVVALFGPTDERATRPLGDHEILTASVFCRPCMLRDCPIDHRCMKRISPEMVFDAVTKHLASA
jgi:lipopolysaccharide heptosyltransferase II